MWYELCCYKLFYSMFYGLGWSPLFYRFFFLILHLGSSYSQVVVSGPTGFVFRAEGILTELGIPPQAVVLLD